MARWLIGAVLILVLPGGVWAQDDDYSIEFAYTLLTKRSVIERELELKFHYEKGDQGRGFEWVGALEWVVLPRWQMELEIPIVLQDPKGGSQQAGIGDIELTNRVLLYKGLDPPTLLTLGLEARMPTGSESRGTGGEATLEPFLAAGMAPTIRCSTAPRSTSFPASTYDPFPGATFAAGVQVPVTSAKAFDYAVRVLSVYEF